MEEVGLPILDSKNSGKCRQLMRKSKTKQNNNAMLVPFLSVSNFHYLNLRLHENKQPQDTKLWVRRGFYTSHRMVLQEVHIH